MQVPTIVPKIRSASFRLRRARRSAAEAGAVASVSVAGSASTQTEHQDGYCPFAQHAVELIGRRWTGSILMVLGERSMRFSEIRSAIPGLSDRLLDTRLTELEVEGIVERTECDSGVRYSKTQKGLDLQPVFESIMAWAEHHAEGDPHVQPGRRRC